MNTLFRSLTTVAFVWLALNSLSLAQPGTLDVTTYGPYSGLAYGRFPPTANHVFTLHDAIVLPDDRVVAGGTCTGGAATPGNRFCLAVWTSDGTGVSLYVHSSAINRVSANAGGALAAQPDGKIVVTAPCRYDASPGTVNQFCTVRFNANFSSDTGFATGFQNTSPSPSSGDSYANAIAIQPDGKIIVAGQCADASGTAFCAARILADGQGDSTFGGASSLRTFLGVVSPSSFDRVKRIALAPNGQIYLGGDCKQSTGFQVACVARLNANGTIDQALSSNTAKPLTFAAIGNGVSSDSIFDMLVQANGNFIFAGSCSNPSSTTRVPCALRLSAPDAIQFYSDTDYLGATVPTVAGNTLREPAAGGAFSIVRIYLQPDGKMLALLRDGMSNSNFQVRRYNEDGSIDASWRQVTFDFNSATDNASGFAVGLALGQQRSGKVIAMGYTRDISVNNPQARVIRFENRANPGRNCSSDIDGDGKVLPTTDGLLLARVAAGLTGNAVISGAIGAGAARSTWPTIRDYLITQCGMVIAP